MSYTCTFSFREEVSVAVGSNTLNLKIPFQKTVWSHTTSFCFYISFPYLFSLLLPHSPCYVLFYISPHLPCLFPFLPQQEDGPSGKQATMVPLVIPVSVPVHRNQTEPQDGWAHGRLGPAERPASLPDRKPSVIVARRRSLRNSMTESFGQVSSVSG